MAMYPGDVAIHTSAKRMVEDRASKALFEVIGEYRDEDLDTNFLWCRGLLNRKFLTLRLQDTRPVA